MWLLCQGAGLKYLTSIVGRTVFTLPPRKLPAKSRGDEEAAAAGRVDRVIHRVVGIRRRDVAGLDSAERVRSADAAEIDVLEVALAASVVRRDVGNVVPVRDADARETALQRVARRDRKAVAVLRRSSAGSACPAVVQRNQVLPAQNRCLARPGRN